MKKIIYGFLFFSAALMAVSCGSSTDKEILKYTTDKTLGIVKINVAQLEKKLPKDEILKDKSADMSKDEKEKLQLVMDAKNNGFDTEKPVYVIADSEGDGFAVTLVGFLSDKAKFEAGFSKITGKKIKTNESNNVYADDQIIGSIKDDMIIFSGVTGNPMASAYGYGGSEKQADAAFYASFWKRKATENKAKVEQITKSLNDKADMSTWVNLYGVINTASRGYIETLAINKQLIDAGIGFDLNFNEGSIDIKASTFFNEELQTLVKKYYNGKEIDYSLVKNIDIDKAKSYGVGYTSLEFIRHFIKEAGFESMANEALLQNVGLTLDDITGGLKGTYAFASYGEIAAEPAVIEEEPVLEASISDDPYADPYGDEYGYDDYPVYNAPKPDMLLALGINGAKAQKLIDFISKNEMFAAYVKTYSNKDIFVVTSNESNLDLLKSGKAAANKKLVKKTGVTSYSWMGGDDINKVAEGKIKTKLVNIESFSKMEDGNSTTELTIKFDKNKKNILHYLLGYE